MLGQLSSNPAGGLLQWAIALFMESVARLAKIKAPSNSRVCGFPQCGARRRRLDSRAADRASLVSLPQPCPIRGCSRTVPIVAGGAGRACGLLFIEVSDGAPAHFTASPGIASRLDHRSQCGPPSLTGAGEPWRAAQDALERGQPRDMIAARHARNRSRPEVCASISSHSGAARTKRPPTGRRRTPQRRAAPRGRCAMGAAGRTQGCRRGAAPSCARGWRCEATRSRFCGLWTSPRTSAATGSLTSTRRYSERVAKAPSAQRHTPRSRCGAGSGRCPTKWQTTQSFRG